MPLHPTQLVRVGALVLQRRVPSPPRRVPPPAGAEGPSEQAQLIKVEAVILEQWCVGGGDDGLINPVRSRWHYCVASCLLVCAVPAPGLGLCAFAVTRSWQFSGALSHEAEGFST